MSRRVHPVVAVLALLVVLVAIAMVYQRRLEEPPPGTGMAGGMGMMQGRRGMRGRGDPGPAAAPGQRVPGMGAGPVGSRAPGGDAVPNETLGINWKPSMSPRGVRVTGFLPAKDGEPVLQRMGIKRGDVITSCNGKAENIRMQLEEAVKQYQDKGTAFSVEVSRDRETITLRTQPR